MARFDIGDTLIHYPELQFSNFTPPLVLQPSEIRHNLQVSTGIGFGFRGKAWEIVSVRQAVSLSLCSRAGLQISGTLRQANSLSYITELNPDENGI
jgi:hypothetical protein